MPTTLNFGSGNLAKSASAIAELGKNALVVTTKVDSYKMKTLEKLADVLKEQGVSVSFFHEAVPNPTLDSVIKGSQLAKELNIDLVIGFGGGSAMDTAKAIAVGATHEGSLWDYIWSSETQPSENTLPIVVIPTTSGTGSQVTQVSVFTNEENRYKSAIYNHNIFPKLAIIDPELMLTVPKNVTAATGFDIFTHAFESYIHANTNFLVRALAKEAIQLVGKNLPLVIAEPNNLQAREQLAIADSLAGMCIANAGVTLPHGMGMAIGGFFPQISHGQSLAIVYPEFVKFTAPSAPDDFNLLIECLSPDSATPLEAISSFLETIGLNKSLSDFDVSKDDLPKLTAQCMVLPDYQANPRVATPDEMQMLVSAIY